MTNFKLDTDADGIALVTWDVPGRSMNVIDLKVIEELSAIVEKIAADAAIKGAVITSGKDTFCAGADLTMLDAAAAYSPSWRRRAARRPAVARLFEESRKLSLLYRRHRDLRQAVGRGDQRHRARRRLRALPRLPSPRRRRQPEDARRAARDQGRPVSRRRRHAAHRPHDAARRRAAIPAQGRPASLAQAKAMKLIDAVVPAADLVDAAKDWIKAGGKAKAPWDADGFRLPGGPVYSKAGMMTFPAANAIYRRETYDNYPAARAIMQVVYEGLQLPIDLGAARRVALVRENPALAGSRRHDPHAVRLHAGAQQGRAPADGRAAVEAQEDRHHRRGLHGRQHRLCHGARGPRGRADRPRPGAGRQGQGAFRTS